MTISITQPDGAEADGQSEAWLSVPVLVQWSAADGEELTILDMSSGTAVSKGEETATSCELIATGLAGGVRFSIGETVKIVLFTCNDEGDTIAEAIPGLYLERANERPNGARSYATAHEALLRAFDTAAISVAAAQTSFETTINATVNAAVATVADLSDQVAAFDARVDALENPSVWTPAQIPNAFFWDKFITDASLRTMTGTRIDEARNGIDNGLALTRNAGTPAIDAATVLNGYHAMRLNGTAELMSVSGGPTANQAWGVIVLTNGSDNANLESFARVGAQGGSGSVGVTLSNMYGAGRPAQEGVPRASTPEPIADGVTPRAVGAQYLPQYSKLIITIDGHAPQQTSGEVWNATKTYANNGSFGHGRAEVAGSANTSAIWDAVFYTGELSASDRAKLLDYWVKKFSLAKLPPRVLIFGDSLSCIPPTAPATVSWSTTFESLLTAQLTIDARTIPTISNIALDGKFIGGDWATQGLTSPTMGYQADGAYVAFRGDVTAKQGLQYTAPLSRSGRREYEIAIVMGGTNDFITGQITGAEWINRAKYVCSQLKAHGYYVVLQTVIPGSDNAGYYGNGGAGTREIHRDTANAWIVGNAIADGYADRVVDHDAAGLTWNATHYGAPVTPDTLHYNNTGGALMAATCFAQVYSLIQEIDP